MSELQKTGQGSAPATLPCAICRDLLPLVQDGVASPESEAAVRAHLARCPACQTLWPEAGAPAAPAPLPDDEKIVRRLQRRMDAWGLVFAAMGLLLGLLFTRSHIASDMLFVLLFPLTGGAAYWSGGRFWRAVPPLAAVLWLLFALTGMRGLVPVSGEPLWAMAFHALPGAAVAAALCLVGTLAAALLKYAFGGKNDEDED